MMYPNGHYFYTTQHKQRPLTGQSQGQAKAVARPSRPIAEIWTFLQLGAATAVVVAAVVVVTSLMG